MFLFLYIKPFSITAYKNIYVPICKYIKIITLKNYFLPNLINISQKYFKKNVFLSAFYTSIRYDKSNKIV